MFYLTFTIIRFIKQLKKGSSISIRINFQKCEQFNIKALYKVKDEKNGNINTLHMCFKYMLVNYFRVP